MQTEGKSRDWWKGWVLAAVIALIIHLAFLLPGPKLPFYVELIVIAVTLISFAIIWRAGSKEDRMISDQMKFNRHNMIASMRDIERRLKRMRKTYLPMWQSINRRIFFLVGDQVIEVGLEQFEVAAIADPDSLPAVWFESFMNNYYGQTPFQDYKIGYKAWTQEQDRFWKVRDASYLTDRNGDKTPIKIESNDDIRDILTFVTKHRDLNEAAFGYIANYGIPTLMKHQNGGKCLELRMLRVMLQLKARIFENELNPDPDSLLGMCP